MAIGKFGSKAAAIATTAKSATPGNTQRISKFGGHEEQEDRDPMPVPGSYIFRVLSFEDNPSPKNKTISWARARLEIVELEGPQAVEAHKVGDVVAMIQQSSGNGAEQGLPRIVSFCRNAAGYETPDEFKAYDPYGYFIDAQCGIVNEYSQRGESIIGRLVVGHVTRGRDTKDGLDYYRNYAWEVVPDDQQDQVGKVGAA